MVFFRTKSKMVPLPPSLHLHAYIIYCECDLHCDCQSCNPLCNIAKKVWKEEALLKVGLALVLKIDGQEGGRSSRGTRRLALTPPFQELSISFIQTGAWFPSSLSSNLDSTIFTLNIVIDLIYPLEILEQPIGKCICMGPSVKIGPPTV